MWAGDGQHGCCPPLPTRPAGRRPFRRTRPQVHMVLSRQPTYKLYHCSNTYPENGVLPTNFAEEPIGLISPVNHAFPEEKIILIQNVTEGSISWNKKGFSYPQGKPEITVKKIVISPPKGKEVIIDSHCHPAPSAAYILKGNLTVTDSAGLTQMVKEGDGVIDSMDTWHKAVISTHTELIVFYAGAIGLPLQVEKGNDSLSAKECF